MNAQIKLLTVFFFVLQFTTHSYAQESENKNIVKVPQTSCEIRLWYNYQVVAIGQINKYWEKKGMRLSKRARVAYNMRHEARMYARFMMQDKEQVARLQKRDTEKYGNPDGPTFRYLIKKNIKKGKTRAEAFQSIIDSSSRTDNKYNEDCE